jgi:transcriptional regulator of acetoin/glycerol metabolism
MISSHRLGTPLLIDITDNGSRMGSALIREELFLPFRSIKSGGYGVDALQIRELIRMERRRSRSNLKKIRHYGADHLTRRPQKASCGSNLSKAAKLLGISRPALYDLMHHHRISLDA